MLGRLKAHIPLRCAALVLAFVIARPCLTPAQSAAEPESPKAVIEAYQKMDETGERLTDSGWYSSSRYFVHPERPPRRRALNVMLHVQGVTDATVKGKRAIVQVWCTCAGQIDPSGRFTSVIGPGLLDETGNLRKEPPPQVAHGPAMCFRRYELVLTDRFWEFGPNHEGPHEIKGPPQWKVEGFEYEPWVTIDAANRYLARLRDSSKSETIRRNAERSIAELQHLRHWREQRTVPPARRGKPDRPASSQ